MERKDAVAIHVPEGYRAGMYFRSNEVFEGFLEKAGKRDEQDDDHLKILKLVDEFVPKPFPSVRPLADVRAGIRFYVAKPELWEFLSTSPYGLIRLWSCGGLDMKVCRQIHRDPEKYTSSPLQDGMFPWPASWTKNGGMEPDGEES